MSCVCVCVCVCVCGVEALRVFKLFFDMHDLGVGAVFMKKKVTIKKLKKINK